MNGYVTAGSLCLGAMFILGPLTFASVMADEAVGDTQPHQVSQEGSQGAGQRATGRSSLRTRLLFVATAVVFIIGFGLPVKGASF